jgi:hypothetical protein
MGEMGEMGFMFVVTTSVVAKSVMADAMTLTLLGLSTFLGTGAIASFERVTKADAKSRGND